MNDVIGQTTDMKVQCCGIHAGSSLAGNRGPRKKYDRKLLPTDIEK
jgi:hypothetical protein